ncbi:MAG: hypothetical protein G01um101438_338 [Parcubacteria group bacterium Gr01-1014_38]|nr:MAG: hypothetical protein G01um101438_338 [Parcubacteria group bacterium Gr01-1014_38]
MDIYLDIDGVLLANDKQPARHVDAFIRYVVERYQTYWLTTHCKGDTAQPLRILSRYLPSETLSLLRQVKPTNWTTLKTEAIDFSRNFLWFDDDVFEEEKTVLQRHNAFASWVEVDLAKNPDQLRDLIKLPLLQGGLLPTA